jgi:hypothetical protein
VVAHPEADVNDGKRADQAITRAGGLGSLHIFDSILDEIDLGYVERNVAKLRDVNHDDFPSQTPHTSVCQCMPSPLVAYARVS